MWNFLLSLIGGPLLKGAMDAYSAKLKAGTTKDKIVADLAMRELEVQTAELQAQNALKIAELGRWYEPEKIAAYIVIFYMAKVMIWDAALHLGTTDAVKGDVGFWAALVMSWYFGKRSAENILKIIGNRFGK